MVNESSCLTLAQTNMSGRETPKRAKARSPARAVVRWKRRSRAGGKAIRLGSAVEPEVVAKRTPGTPAAQASTRAASSGPQGDTGVPEVTP